MKLAPLCTLELSFDDPLELVQTVHGDGGIYGTGSGVADGERLSGTVRWTNHPRVRADGTTLPDLHGVIELGDGVKVMFQMSGVSTLLADGVNRDTRASITFTAPAGPYGWLNDAFCVCEGAYDVTTERGRFVIHQVLSRQGRERTP
jgi:uncharacterized protein DUF3237